jgi:hypothetical protein
VLRLKLFPWHKYLINNFVAGCDSSLHLSVNTWDTEQELTTFIKTSPFRNAILLFCLTIVATTCGYASVALLMEEPYGTFGAMNPTGHAAVYFNHICVDSPTVLRPCHDGEFGVVISRYHKIDGYDWIAIPLIGYLYAVNLSFRRYPAVFPVATRSTASLSHWSKVSDSDGRPCA